MAGAEQAAHVWKEWGIQVLVLLSFTLQLTLLILAEFRRCVDSGLLRSILWLAYQLADSTAIYVLGHMSIISRSPEHELVAFWAPFLLLHLGGQDNITAYAIEDNRLWPRHLLTSVVQVAAAAYILYNSSILSSRSSLLWATILMLVTSVVKYGERVWALRCAASTPTGSNYQVIARSSIVGSPVPHSINGPRDEEALTFLAHLELDFPMDLLKGSFVHPKAYHMFIKAEVIKHQFWGVWIGGLEQVYKVVEIQLSLLHDVLYTKAGVMGTWYGLCIRIFSPLATVGALLLFYRLGDHHKGSYSRVDVSVTYVLLVGAVVLEMTSLLRAVFSSWTTYGLIFSRSRSVYGDFLPWATRLMDVGASLRRLVRAEGWTRRCSWSRSIGQHNLIQLVAGSKFSKRSMIARWMRLEDPWNVLAYSWSIPVSPFILQRVVKQVESWRSDHHIICPQGQEALKRWGLYDHMDWSVEDSILAWHIGTDVYLHWYKEQEKDKAEQRADLAKAVEALSNYMLFLLAARPDMLPPSARRSAYVEVCDWLTGHRLQYYRDAKGLVGRLQAYRTTPLEPKKPDNWGRGMQIGAALGQKLIGEDIGEMLELIVEVWAEMLCYVGNGCSVYSHAKQLANGGELITIVALLILHLKNGAISSRPEPV